jgi:Domain of unknown function (DUF6898)
MRINCRARPEGGLPKDEILLEFVVQGGVVKVTAIDAATGIEASLVGPATAGRQVLAQAAARKLKYVLEKSAKA